MPSLLPSRSAVDSIAPPQTARELDRSQDGSEMPFAGIMAQYTAPPPAQTPAAEIQSPKPNDPVDAAGSTRGALVQTDAGNPASASRGPNAGQGPVDAPRPPENQGEAGRDALTRTGQTQKPLASATEAAAPTSVPPPAPVASLPAQAPAIQAPVPPLPATASLPPASPISPEAPVVAPPAGLSDANPTPPIAPIAALAPATSEAPIPPSARVPTGAPLVNATPGKNQGGSPLEPVPESLTAPSAPPAIQTPTPAPPSLPLGPPPPVVQGAETPTASAAPVTPTVPVAVDQAPQADPLAPQGQIAVPVSVISQAVTPEAPTPPTRNQGPAPISSPSKDKVPLLAPPQAPTQGQRGPTLLETPPALPPKGANEPVITSPKNSDPTQTARAAVPATPVPPPSDLGQLAPALMALAVGDKGNPRGLVRSLGDAPVQTGVTPGTTSQSAATTNAVNAPAFFNTFKAPEASTSGSADPVTTLAGPVAMASAPSSAASPALPLNQGTQVRFTLAPPDLSPSTRIGLKEGKEVQSKASQEPASTRSSPEAAANPAPEASKPTQPSPESAGAAAARNEPHASSAPTALPTGTPQSLSAPIEPGSIAAPLSPGTPAAPAHPVAIQVGDSLKWILRQANPSAELQLHPENLGKVTIQLKVDGTQVHAKVWASEASTLPLLQDHKAYLEVSLRQQGLNLGSFDLQQGSRGHQPQGEASSKPAFGPSPEEKAALARQETPSTLAPTFASSHRIEVLA